jgi:hypothetical protein
MSIDQFYPPGHPSASNVTVTASDNVHHCGDSPPTVSITASDCDTSCTISATPFAGTHPLNDSSYPQFPGTVTIAVNGTQICSSSKITDGVPVQCGYKPTFSGGGTITATVTDSVLYSGSDSKTVNFTRAAQPQSLTINTATKTDASWSGGQSGTTYTLTDVSNGQTLCSTSQTSCNYFGKGVKSGDTLQLTDNSGDIPATKQVS